MKPFSYLSNLVCSSCSNSFDGNHIQTYCPDCNAPLLPIYDLAMVKREVDRDAISYRPKGMWRWHELLPVHEPANIITLGEGDTPLLPIRNFGVDWGMTHLFVKEEGLNPTGSFKARGLSVAVSRARELGITRFVIPSAGNAGGALAAYAARAGTEALVYMPKSSPRTNVVESQIMGANVELVDGLIDLAGKFAAQKEGAEGWFNMSTFKEPYRVEGKKSWGTRLQSTWGGNYPMLSFTPPEAAPGW
jgi:threonine synthase